jgi:hypothetical protein
LVRQQLGLLTLLEELITDPQLFGLLAFLWAVA